MTFEELMHNVEQWGHDKGILLSGDPKTQLLKTVSELGELADNIAKGDHLAAEDDFGDILVTLILLAKMCDIELVNCLAGAYNIISQRTGKMVNGTFVKDQ